MTNKKDLDKLMDVVKTTPGWVVTTTTGGHYKIKPPKGRLLFVGKGPNGEHRSYKNFEAELRRAGFDFDELTASADANASQDVTVTFSLAQALMVSITESAMSFDEVAIKLGVTGHQVYEWSKGKSTPPTDQLHKLASLFPQVGAYVAKPPCSCSTCLTINQTLKEKSVNPRPTAIVTEKPATELATTSAPQPSPAAITTTVAVVPPAMSMLEPSQSPAPNGLNKMANQLITAALGAPERANSPVDTKHAYIKFGRQAQRIVDHMPTEALHMVRELLKTGAQLGLSIGELEEALTE